MSCKTSYLLFLSFGICVCQYWAETSQFKNCLHFYYYQIHKMDSGPPYVLCYWRFLIYYHFFPNISKELPDDSAGSELFMKLSSVFFLRAFYTNCSPSFTSSYIICHYPNWRVFFLLSWQKLIFQTKEKLYYLTDSMKRLKGTNND